MSCWALLPLSTSEGASLSLWSHVHRSSVRQREGCQTTQLSEKLHVSNNEDKTENEIFIILRHIVYNMKAKSSTQMERFFTRRLPIAFTLKTMLVHVSERENVFSLNYSKFALECDWNSKISQNLQNLGLFWKNRSVFRKNWFFSKLLNVANFL